MFLTPGKVMWSIKTTRRVWSEIPFKFETPEFAHLPSVTKNAAILALVDYPITRIGPSLGRFPPSVRLYILHSAYSIGAPTGITSGGVAAGRGAAPASFTTLTGAPMEYAE